VADSLNKLGQFIQNKLSHISHSALVQSCQILASAKDLDQFRRTSLLVKLTLQEPLNRPDETLLLRCPLSFKQASSKLSERVIFREKRVKDMVEMSFAPGEEALEPDLEILTPYPPQRIFATPIGEPCYI